MAEILNLDELDLPPLRVRVAGQEYDVDITVAVMRKVTMATEAGPDVWALTRLALAEAGFPPEQLDALGANQARALSEAIARHFFPGVATTPLVSEERLSAGPNSSPASSATSAAATSTETTPAPDAASGT